ncbi:MAG: LacI family DNA-binding transcriptional regulator [Lachnospiraceae bacterium]
MRITLQDIADKAGVSRGTVDRAIHNRGSINPEVAKRIRKLAQEMGYKPNIGGRALALAKKNYKIGAIVQFSETPFVKSMTKGLEAAIAEIEELGCSVLPRRVEGVNAAKTVQYMEEFLEEGINALAVIAYDDELLRQEIHKYHEAGIPVITFNSDIPDSDRICFLGQDSLKCGRVAGGIIGDLLQGSGKVAILSGSDNVTIHQNRMKGCIEVMEERFPDIEIVSLAYTYNNPDILGRQTRELLQSRDDIDLLYIDSAGVFEVIKVLKEMNVGHKIKVIVQDMSGWDTSYMLDGTIDYCIDDDAYYQGYEPIMLLFRYLYHNELPDREYLYTDIHIISRYII